MTFDSILSINCECLCNLLKTTLTDKNMVIFIWCLFVSFSATDKAQTLTIMALNLIGFVLFHHFTERHTAHFPFISLSEWITRWNWLNPMLSPFHLKLSIKSTFKNNKFYFCQMHQHQVKWHHIRNCHHSNVNFISEKIPVNLFPCGLSVTNIFCCCC